MAGARGANTLEFLLLGVFQMFVFGYFRMR